MNWYLGVLQKYAVFEGRARRQEYWMFILFNMIFAIAAIILDVILGTFGVIYILYVLGVLIPGLAVLVRRLHDVDKSGWFFLVSLIPLVGPIWLLVVLCMDSTPGYNRFGPNPKGVEAPLYNNYPPSYNYDSADQMRKLSELRQAGIISEEEFNSKKQELLMRM